LSISTVPRKDAGVAALAPGTVGIVASEIERRRLKALLERSSFRVAAGAADVHSLLDRARGPLDLVVLVGDAALLARGGPVELLRTLRPSSPVVVVACGEDRALMRKALRAGVGGYVSEQSVERALAATVTAVLAGQLAVPRSIRSRIAWASFSAREQQVLQLVAAGLTNGEIADRLYLSASTVKSHLSSSFRKLGVSSRAEAAAAVLDPDNGLATGARLSAPLGTLERQLLASRF
jgi:DNA-binding NarL/FixJ family response regulator